MLKYISILIIGFVLGLVVNNFLNQNKNKEIVKIVERIDTLYGDRLEYLKDTIYVQKKIITTHYDTVKTHIDSIFSGNGSSKKSELFDSVYFSKDTVKFIDISSDQAKQAIETKFLMVRDSSLLDLCEKNVSQCDGTLVKIKNETDSIKNIKIPEEHNVRNFAYGIFAGFLLGIGFDFFLNK